MAGPIDEDDDDDPNDYTPPPGPSKRDTWKGWAEGGDVEQLLGLLRSKPLCLFNVPEMLRLLLRACQVRSRSDPRGFAEFLFAEMAAFDGFLLLRTQLQLAGRVGATGEGMGQPGIVALSPDVDERLLPRLVELQRGLGEVLAAQAATTRMWALADAKRAANGEATGAPPDAPDRCRRADSRKAGRTRHASNGKAVGVPSGVNGSPGGRRRRG